MYLLKLSGGRVGHSGNASLLYFYAEFQLSRYSALLIFMYDANFRTEFGNTMEVRIYEVWNL